MDTKNIKGKVYKSKYTHEQLLKKLQAGESVKATDLMSSMGITTIVFGGDK